MEEHDIKIKSPISYYLDNWLVTGWDPPGHFILFSLTEVILARIMGRKTGPLSSLVPLSDLGTSSKYINTASMLVLTTPFTLRLCAFHNMIINLPALNPLRQDSRAVKNLRNLLSMSTRS